MYGALRLPGLDPDNPVQMGPGFFVDNRGKRSASLDLKVHSHPAAPLPFIGVVKASSLAEFRHIVAPWGPWRTLALSGVPRECRACSIQPGEMRSRSCSAWQTSS